MMHGRTGCSSAWLEHQTGGLGVGGSNPLTLIFREVKNAPVERKSGGSVENRKRSPALSCSPFSPGVSYLHAYSNEIDPAARSGCARCRTWLWTTRLITDCN